MVIFYSYVSLPEGILALSMMRNLFTISLEHNSTT